MEVMYRNINIPCSLKMLQNRCSSITTQNTMPFCVVAERFTMSDFQCYVHDKVFSPINHVK